MSLEDPFLIVQNEVFDALHKLRNTFTRWTELQSNPGELSREDYQDFVTELKNGLKSIQWDLDELAESLENSERTSTIDSNELQKRQTFIDQTREEVKSMNEQVSNNSSKLFTKKAIDYSINFGGSGSSQQLNQQGTKYYRLINEPDASAASKNFEDEEHKSPYVPNHSVTLDEVDPNINVINNSAQGKIQRLRQLWTTLPDRQKFIVGLGGTALLVILIFLLY